MGQICPRFLGMKFALLLCAVAAANALVLDRYGTGSGTSCTTNWGSACVFPFNFMGVSHFACTTIDGDSPWCATQTDDNDDIDWWGDAPWGYCDASCPMEDTTTTTTTTATTTTCQCGLKGGSTNTIGNSRIIGGQDTELHEYPWQVGLVWRNGHDPRCGGTLISSTHVLTAAHCTVGDTPSNIRVLLGEHNITDSDFNRVDVAEIIEHPNYNKRTRLDNDYAILRLANPVAFTNKVSPACLPADLDVTYAGVLATATGWGITSWGGREPDVLQEVNVTVTTNTECNNAWKIVPNVDITANMICATDYGKSVCKGDSGGPLMVPENGRQTVIGISSFVYGKGSVGCAVEGRPSGFARVTEKMDWILAKTAGTFSSTCAPLN